MYQRCGTYYQFLRVSRYDYDTSWIKNGVVVREHNVCYVVANFREFFSFAALCPETALSENVSERAANHEASLYV